MIDRYTRPQMKTVWSTRRKLENWLRIEILVCEYLAGTGEIPKTSLARIRKKARVDPRRMDAIEKKVKHDVIAFLTMISEKVGPDARFIHLGLTSSDVLDTGLSIQLKEASGILLDDLVQLKEIFRKRAFEFKNTLMVGRSHGIHGEPITFGFKLALWYAEMDRNIDRLQAAREAVRFGKISGAMGTFAHLSPEVEEYV
ncbi:MAG TPA: lyase family protein, partial [Nitrospiria bacterium]